MHAIEAFRLAAVDYLLKPVQKYRVVEAVERARARRSVGDEKLETLFDVFRGVGRMPPAQEFEAEMWVSSRRKTVRLVLSTVDVFEAERDYIRVISGRRGISDPGVHARARRNAWTRGAFCGVHRSAIVNIDRVAENRACSPGRG